MEEIRTLKSEGNEEEGGGGGRRRSRRRRKKNKALKMKTVKLVKEDRLVVRFKRRYFRFLEKGEREGERVCLWRHLKW